MMKLTFLFVCLTTLFLLTSAGEPDDSPVEDTPEFFEPKHHPRVHHRVHHGHHRHPKHHHHEPTTEAEQAEEITVAPRKHHHHHHAHDEEHEFEPAHHHEHAHSHRRHHHEYQHGHASKYTINYQVRDKASHNFYGHRQWTESDGTIHGQYYVFMADHRTQVVHYTVCKKSGYKATVKYFRGIPAPWKDE